MTRKFPTLCIDNFYEDPDKVRQFALSQEFTKTDTGAWPGSRTKQIADINPDVFRQMCCRLFSVFYDFDYSPVEWTVDTTFQLSTKMDENPFSPKNMGWIHKDSYTLFTAIIYLTPGIDPHTGTSLYECVQPDKVDLLAKSLPIKEQLYKDGIDDGYDDAMMFHHRMFRETTRFDNIYNRMIMFDGTETWHGVKSFYTDVPRLTQTIFVYKLDSQKQEYPLQKMERFVI